MKLTEINVYPIKSLGGISLSSAVVEKRGLRYDRRWMLVNSNNDFMTQRQYPKMALLQPSFDNHFLVINHKTEKLPSLRIPIQNHSKEEIEVPIWEDFCMALTLSKEVDEWFSQVLKVPCRLVYMPDTTKRRVDPKYSPQEKIVSFADAYPFLIIGEKSLEELNSRLDVPVPMNRFRPNFVFNGGEPFIEDTFNNFKIGDLPFQGVKPSARCVITTVNQNSGEKGAEPLTTLSTFRKYAHKVLFGQNLIGHDEGIVSVGDEIIPIDFKESNKIYPSL
jgi:uncharacterized protein